MWLVDTAQYIDIIGKRKMSELSTALDRRKKGTVNTESILCLFIFLFAFQTILDNYISAFSYIDEIVALIAMLLFGKKALSKGRIGIKSEYKSIIIWLLLYVCISLFGNILYRYQKASSVVIDLFTNLKFYLSIGFVGSFVMRDPQTYKRVPKLGKILTLFLFGLFIVDYVLNIFPHDYRYGIKYSMLYFGHPTYFAGFLAFLVSLLAYYGAKKNIKYIILDLIMMFMTLRGKAIAGALVFLFLFYIVIIRRSKLKVWQIGIIAVLAIAVAWQQIQFYFVELSGSSARSVMLRTSLKVLKDYFPIGTGFGTYGSHEAATNYSPVYINYGFRMVGELSGYGGANFFDDQFWPIIFGQSGFIGTICYFFVLGTIFTKVQKLKKINSDIYIASMFAFMYLLISSTSEPAYNNALAVPLGVVIGMAFLSKRKRKQMNRLN